MTLEIGFLFALLASMVVLFLTERLPVDLTAFLGLVVLILAGYLGPSEAFAGFASPAVITMLSIFIVSGALLRTGVADMVGGRIHALVGSREVPLIITLMLVGGVLSAFMNNIAATAVLMPAVASVARRAGLSPSRLFMPLAFGAILGGTTTLVGTPPNILAAEMLRERGLEPFRLFDFAPVGIPLLLVGTLFMATIGRRLLPDRQIEAPTSGRDLARVYQLHNRLFCIRVAPGSRLDGSTLRESRLGSTLRVNVVAIVRDGRRRLAPDADALLRGGDLLLVEGELADLQDLVRVQGVEIQAARIRDLPRAEQGIRAVAARLNPGCPLEGATLKRAEFRSRWGVIVIGIRRGGEMLRGRVAEHVLREGDELIAVGSPAEIDRLSAGPEFRVRSVNLRAVRQLQENTFLIRIPEGSPLVGESVSGGRIGELLGLTIGGLVRDGETRLIAPDEVIRAGDRFLVTGEPAGILGLIELGEIQLDPAVGDGTIESDEIGVVEVALAPRSGLIGRTLGDLEFRDRYGLQVLAIWREGSPIHRDLPHTPLHFGDALLVQGPHERVRRLASDPDFVVLSQSAQAERRSSRAPFALGGLLLMIGMVVTGHQPIHVAAFTAASLVLLFRTLTMEEAYRAIEWRAIFLVAAVLPVGIAMERTGAAHLLAATVTETAGTLGPYGILAALVLLSSALSQGLDGAPAVVLLTPVALGIAEEMGISPFPIMMGVSVAASAAFMTPFSHKANLLVMGAGGYRALDYLKVGTPLTVVLLAVIVLLAPVLLPF